MYATRTCFRDTGVCQGTDWQFSLHMYAQNLILQEKINTSFSFLSFQMAIWKLIKYPCIFDMQDKVNIHNTECQVLSRFLSNVSVANYFYNLGEINTLLLTHCYFTFQVPFILMGCAWWVFQIRRQSLLQDLWTCLNNAATPAFRKMLKVRYQIVFFVSSGYIATVFFGFQCYCSIGRWVLVFSEHTTKQLLIKSL